MPTSTEDVYRQAARMIAQGRRVELSSLGEALHISRTTLFRKAGTRERIMGEALWWQANESLTRAEARWRRAYGSAVRDHTGTLRCVRILTDHGSATAADAGIRHLLDEEPALATRVLTDPFGCVQPRVIAVARRLFEADASDADLRMLVDVDSLCYAVVRLGESFLYADQLANRRPDIDAANTLVAALIQGVLQPR
ncbi:QsdR family transcriptional regulator [Nocardia fluminea]|uniref:QsdR family transcriptional regulator n=1 Tax=Nocardia fluminea TaxID=134984 RepID=UPI00342CCEFC